MPPEPLATHDVQLDADTVVTLRRHGNPNGPRLVLSHGNGLAIDLYYPFWSLLLDDFDIIVHDIRNHGWNPVGPMERHNLPTFIRDHDRILEAIDAQFGSKPQVGVFHSISALIALLSPARGRRFSGLFLFDPPVCKPGRTYEELDAAAVRNAEMIRRRTEKFKTRRELIEILPYMPAFQQVVDGVGQLLAETTLREAADGDGYELRCPREYEGQIMEYAGIFAVSVDFESMACPVKVMGADPTVPYSYLPTLDLSDITTVDYDFIADATHLMLLEQPQECAQAVQQYTQQILQP